MIGSPLAGDRMLLVDIISARASSWASSVSGRCTVEQHWVFANHFGENVPHLWQLALDHLLRSLDGGRETTHFQLAENERFEQLESHLLRQTALVQTQSRAHGNNGTTGVVHALTEQVLTETTLLTLDNVSQGFQRTLVRASDA